MSDYNPRNAKISEPNPQTDPDLFDTEDLTKEVKYLLDCNRRHGSHPLRTLKIINLRNEIAARERGETAFVTEKR